MAKIYIDGQENISQKLNGFGAIASNDKNAYLGSYRGTDYWLNGRLDETAIWQRALDSNEINSLWNNGNGSLITTSPLTNNLVAYWQMDNNWNDNLGNYDAINSTASFTIDAKLGTHAGLFDGISATTTLSDTLTVNNAITIATWVYKDQASLDDADNIQTIYNKGAEGNNEATWLYTIGDIFYFEIGNGIIRDEIATSGTAIAQLDLHLKSEYGYWTESGWLNATQTSPAIDAANPTSDYTNEPAYNGGRANCGVYGNTAQASKSAGSIEIFSNGFE